MARGYLTTHVLDTALGRPAEGVKLSLFRLEDTARTRLTMLFTNADGRTDEPVLPEAGFAPGTYELVFRVGDYLDRTHGPAEQPRFLDLIPIRFSISDADAHYHVPLLLSPYGYSTYRGS